MDAIKTARELGKIIQADPRYKAYYAAKNTNDNDKGLQELIGEFYLLRQKLSVESHKGDEDSKAKVAELNEQTQAAYTALMENPNMKAFTEAKSELDAMIREISTIISLCCDGEDPDTCEAAPVQQGGCSSGGGCTGCGRH